MTSATAEPAESLRLRRLFPARRDRVFQAWTSPEALKQWWSPPGHVTPYAEVDLKVGGRYRLGMQRIPDGDIFYLSGIFVEVAPPEKLVYTWRWEANYEMEETLVTVEFQARGEATEVILTHARFQSEQQVALHNQGWQGCLDGMERYLRTAEGQA